MPTDNSVILVGNITRDPELRFTNTGQPTASFGLAVNRRWQNRQTQEWEEAVSFFDVVCWRDLAENVALSLTKGMRVVVTGRIEQRSRETDDGEHRSKVEIVADEIGPSLRFATADAQRTQRRQATEESSESSDAEEAFSEACVPSRVTGWRRWPDPGHTAPDSEKGNTR